MNATLKNMTQVIFSHRFLMFILIMSCALLANSQKGLLHGKVVDSDGEPIPGAIISAVMVDSTAQSNSEIIGVVCDLDGNYSVALNEGKYNIEARFVRFKTSQIVLKINSGGDIIWNFVLDPEEEVLGIVVISAGKFEQDLGEVTVSMEVIKPKLIQDKNSNSIDEILQQTPGVAIVDDEPQIRSGSGYSFGAGSRVQILMDDIPMISGDAGKPTWDFLPIENLSQVEVIKGASSVLYGSSALSGAINMRTAFPGDKPETQVTVFHGVFSTPQTSEGKYWSGMPMKTGGSFLHKRKVGNLDFVIGGYFLGSDGHLGPQRDSITGEFKNGYNPFTADRYEAETRGRMNVNLRYRSKKVVGLSYGVNTNWSLSNSLSTLIWENNTDGLYGAYQGSATRTEQTLGTVDPFVVYTPKEGVKHSLRGRWQTLDNKNDNNQGNFSDVFYGEYQFQRTWNTARVKNLTTNIGAVSTNTYSRGQLYVGGNEGGENTATNRAVYFQVDKKWGKVNASGGVRYEMFDINGSKESKPVYRAGLNYKVAKATYIRASYGQGYRFPSIAEKFIVTALGAVKIYSNPDLQSETSYNAEFGIKQGFKIGNFKGFADIAVFQQEFKNYIEFTFGQWASVPTIENLFGFGFKSINTGNSRVRGAEISVMGEGKIGPVKFEMLGGYTYTLPESLTPDLVYARRNDLNSTEVTYANTSSDPTNNILKYRLQHLVRFDLQGTWRSVSLGGSFRYNSHMQNIDNAFEFLETTVPMFFDPGIVAWRESHTVGDFIFDSRISWKVNEHHKVAFVVNNVLNREYAIRPLSIEEPRLSTVQYTFNF